MTKTPIHYGRNLNRVLSNLYPSKLLFRNRGFACAEGAYHAFKTGFYVAGFEKLDGPSALRTARQMGLKRKSFGPEYPDDDFVIGLMREILEARYQQDTEFRFHLNEAEGISHPVGDPFWREWYPRLLNQLRDKHAERRG